MNIIYPSKGEIIQRSGDLHTKVYVVKKGLLRSYAIDEKGKEHIFMFGPEGWTVADNQAPEVPCDLFIDALEDSVVIVLEKNLEREDIKARPLINRLAVLQQRIIMLMSAPAIKRYEHFVVTYPDIIQRVPQKMVASYLGITPEALSKVKGERKHK
ncbi:Crp/Fnr family transcriptional regulator [Lewinella sp. LCG006]|uniref:Crp/Fnr family transcriptional regulator n=1 Tax=Lewinella sp. LCG006 TaxID=3231911 RepID=UPI00345F212D